MIELRAEIKVNVLLNEENIFNVEPINIFDFDGTLTTETWPKFWVWVKKFGYNGDERNECLEKALAEYRNMNVGNALEIFFAFFNDLLVDNNSTITYEELLEGEKLIKYNLGVIDFIAKSSIRNYIVSGGLKEFLQNLNIAKYFDDIYGTPVQHDKNGLIVGIGEVMTDDKKIFAICDILKKNGRKENDCRNVYFIGDGYSDASAMRFVHNNGGKSIFVYQSNQDDDLYHSMTKSMKH
ncbi:MAG TPA: hypothetical protein DCP90_09590 [Clostridiales bacterium]|nr:MAG: hypothetical protein A2Y22_08405 [Clostridiales bacterium GWD2_32_59]HAN10840.1 hypothetical protein [Clostridiales bacterium]